MSPLCQTFFLLGFAAVVLLSPVAIGRCFYGRWGFCFDDMGDALSSEQACKSIIGSYGTESPAALSLTRQAELIYESVPGISWNRAIDLAVDGHTAASLA